MFIKIANNRQKIINTALEAGYRQKANRKDRLVSNFIRVQDNVISSLSVSYRKNDPAVTIQHFRTDGTRRELMRIIRNKKTWEETISWIDPENLITGTQSMERKKDTNYVRSGSTN